MATCDVYIFSVNGRTANGAPLGVMCSYDALSEEVQTSSTLTATTITASEMREFATIAPRDGNVQFGVGQTEPTTLFYVAAGNHFDVKLAASHKVWIKDA